MLLKLEKCIPISHVTLEMVPKYANIERPTSSQLYASQKVIFSKTRMNCMYSNSTARATGARVQSPKREEILIICSFFFKGV